MNPFKMTNDCEKDMTDEKCNGGDLLAQRRGASRQSLLRALGGCATELELVLEKSYLCVGSS